jgi:hypothetical protein
MRACTTARVACVYIESKKECVNFGIPHDVCMPCVMRYALCVVELFSKSCTHVMHVCCSVREHVQHRESVYCCCSMNNVEMTNLYM